jgi:hypothetical protein
MTTVKKLKAALAAVPLQEPCTAGAVDALHTAGAAAFRILTGEDLHSKAAAQLLDACAHQGLPGACMPVLTWLAAGLRSGLPPAATQQAHEMACALLWVVSQVVSFETQQALAAQEVPSAHIKRTATGYLRHLGTTGEQSC